MSKRDIEIDNMLNAITIFVERAKVLTEDVQQGFFGQNIKSLNDAWRIMPPYYNHAGVKIDIVNDVLFDLAKMVDDLQAFIKQKEGDSPVRED